MLARVQPSLTLTTLPQRQQRCLLGPERRALLAVPPAAANGVPPEPSGDAADGGLSRLKALETEIGRLKAILELAGPTAVLQYQDILAAQEGEVNHVKGELNKISASLGNFEEGNTPAQQALSAEMEMLESKQAKFAEAVKDLKGWYVGLASLLLFLAASVGTALALVELLRHSS
ncbi:hypothetical protein D9Q98_003087 [Chlorella vulgaris]|uniref:Uncharacterized protein n=1 Tax=Chlorella vulgaris TaxID=3077 RepID=A0A9D4TUR6_CHLVU|nr:hypothetical protein D9Q98_003087 [Chlorella vulgaris]